MATEEKPKATIKVVKAIDLPANAKVKAKREKKK